MHILVTYVHSHIKCEVSIFNPIATGVLCTDADDNDADDANNTNDTNDKYNYARWTKHDYIGSFGIIPNEPKS